MDYSYTFPMRPGDSLTMNNASPYNTNTPAQQSPGTPNLPGPIYDDASFQHAASPYLTVDAEHNDAPSTRDTSDHDLTPEKLVVSMQNMAVDRTTEEVLVDSLLPWLIANSTKEELDDFIRLFKAKAAEAGRKRRAELPLDKPAGVRKSRHPMSSPRKKKMSGKGKENENGYGP